MLENTLETGYGNISKYGNMQYCSIGIEYGIMGMHPWPVLHMASTNKLRSYDYYILELYCSPILSESDRLDYSFPPVLGFDVFWAPASRRQQNDQLGEDPEFLSLALTA